MTDSLSESLLDNALVRQKDHILTFVNEGKLLEAVCMLSVVKDMWWFAGYAYKWYEILKRIDDHEGVKARMHPEKAVIVFVDDSGRQFEYIKIKCT